MLAGLSDHICYEVLKIICCLVTSLCLFVCKAFFLALMSVHDMNEYICKRANEV